MSAIQFQQKPFTQDQLASRESRVDTLPKASVAEAVIELGTALAGMELIGVLPGRCSSCRMLRNPLRSTAQFPKIFCSQGCEQEFVRVALDSLTVDDCIRIHERLATLLLRAQRVDDPQEHECI